MCTVKESKEKKISGTKESTKKLYTGGSSHVVFITIVLPARESIDHKTGQILVPHILDMGFKSKGLNLVSCILNIDQYTSIIGWYSSFGTTIQ